MRSTEPLWTVRELAEYLGVPAPTIYYWRTIGYGPKGTKIGRYVRYQPEEVRDWFESRSKETRI